MSWRELITQVAVALTCLAGLNGLVRTMSRHTVPRQVATRIDQSTSVTDLFVGNSLMEAGLNSAVFERTKPGRLALNIGLGATTPVEHNVLLRRALHLKPNRVYYGFFDLQLVVNAPSRWGDLVGNRSLIYEIEPETAIRFYADNDPVRALLMRSAARFPLFVERSTLWSRVEQIRRRLAAIGLPTQVTNRFGRAKDFRLLEAADPEAFQATCQVVVSQGQGIIPAVADMLQLLRKDGVALICIEMPMPTGHRRRFYDNPAWQHLRDYLVDHFTRAGGHYLQASAWIDDEGFADDLHLNEKGAREFSTRLATAEVRVP